MNGPSYVKIPLKTQALLNIQNKDKYYFLWSILAHLHPCSNGHPERTSKYAENFNELNFDGFDITVGFKVSNVKKIETANKLSIIIFGLKFYPVSTTEGETWKYNLIPVALCSSENGDDLLIYKNYYVLIKKLHVIIGKPKCKFICRRCSSCFEYEHVLKKHKKTT